MSTPGSFVELLMETSTSHMKRLDPLQINGSGPRVHLQEYHLESIFKALYRVSFYKAKHPTDTPHLNPLEQKKMVEICMQVVDSEEMVTVSDLESLWRCQLLAMKILTLIATLSIHQEEPHSRETLDMIYGTLIKKLQMPELDHIEPKALKQAMQLMAISACCLAHKTFHCILSPEDANNLIRNLIMPLTVRCLNSETKDKESLYEVLYHVETNRYYIGDCFYDELDYTYPRLIWLISQLADYSESSDSKGGYFKELESSLDTAIETGKITDEHIVGLYALRVSRGYCTELLVDLLSKSNGLHRVHLADMIGRNVLDRFYYHSQRDVFAEMMIEDLITKYDDQLNDIALNSLYTLGEFYLIHPDVWPELVEGKEIGILRKLLEISSKPAIYWIFLRHFETAQTGGSPHSIEFDELARVPISRTINQIYHSTMFGFSPRYKLYENVCCLKNLIRLRKHRLECNQEEKLIEVFSVRLERYRISDYIDPFMFANYYQIYAGSWNECFKLIQYIKQYRSEFLRDSQQFDLTYQAHKLLSYFLMADAAYFYAEFGSEEVLELIYDHCKRAFDSEDFAYSLMKEILFTWPHELEKTKLESSEHYRLLLNKFIGLLIGGLEGASEKVSASEISSQCHVFVNLLSGLAIAFTRHRAALHDVLDSLGNHKREDRDTWLKDNILNWTKLMIECGKENCDKGSWFQLFKLNEFANVIIAYEGLMMIKTDYHECPKLAELVGPLIEVIRMVLDRGIEHAPVDSIETNRYKRIKASLPA